MRWASLGFPDFRVVLGAVKDDAFGIAAFGGCFAILDCACARRGSGGAFAVEGAKGELITLRIYEDGLVMVERLNIDIAAIERHDGDLSHDSYGERARVSFSTSQKAATHAGAIARRSTTSRSAPRKRSALVSMSRRRSATSKRSTNRSPRS